MISGVLLSAGKSERMGGQKVLLKLGERTVIENLLGEYLNSNLIEVVLVLGKNASAVKEFIESVFEKDNPLKKSADYKGLNPLKKSGDSKGVKLRIVINENYEKGMFSSIQAGLREIKGDAVLLGLADNPLIHRGLINFLISHFSGSDILIPTFNERKGHPVLFSKPLIEEILSSDPEHTTLRDIFNKHNDIVRLLEMQDEAVCIDMDTKEDYEQVKKLWLK